MNELRVSTSAELVRGLRRTLGLSQQEVADRSWIQRGIIARIELGREPRLTTLRRLVGALGGRIELAARFERPLEALSGDFQRERDERRQARLALWRDRRRT